eukprot:TRINITY_DN35427_c0_g1_i1.p1 TRINITY_DN35427_c0_g1~~TRINITY_DN35427_c0_g1_i1.p1  ORF type:complete len:220 (-),score=0.86 TRINITY_DN35427_c0_g1_i1:86-745(-)
MNLPSMSSVWNLFTKVISSQASRTTSLAIVGSVVLDFMDFSKQCEAEELRIRQRAPELSKHLIHLHRWENFYPEPRKGEKTKESQPWQVWERLLHQTKHEHNAAAVSVNDARIFVKAYWEDVFYADKRSLLGTDIVAYLQQKSTTSTLRLKEYDTIDPAVSDIRSDTQRGPLNDKDNIKIKRKENFWRVYNDFYTSTPLRVGRVRRYIRNRWNTIGHSA